MLQNVIKKMGIFCTKYVETTIKKCEKYLSES